MNEQEVKEKEPKTVKSFLTEKVLIAVMGVFTAGMTILSETRHRSAMEAQQQIKDNLETTVARLEERISSLKESERNFRDELRYMRYRTTASNTLSIAPFDPTVVKEVKDGPAIKKLNEIDNCTAIQPPAIPLKLEEPKNGKQ